MSLYYFTTTSRHINVLFNHSSIIRRFFRVTTMSKNKVTSYFKPTSSGDDTKSDCGKSDKKKEEFVFFFGQNYVFSQFHKVDFTVDGEQYCCMEQYMHHQKALTFKDKKTAREIMLETEPKLHKKLGRKVSPFDPKIWGKKSVEVVKKGNIEKFSQNEKLRDIMFSTYPKTLVETSPRDRLWGIGLGKNNEKAKDRSQWRGKNLLGQTLTEVRDILMEKFGIDKETAEKQPELELTIETKSSSSKKTSSKSVTPKKTPVKNVESTNKKIVQDTNKDMSEKITPVKDKVNQDKSSSTKKRKQTTDVPDKSPTKKEIKKEQIPDKNADTPSKEIKQGSNNGSSETTTPRKEKVNSGQRKHTSVVTDNSPKKKEIKDEQIPDKNADTPSKEIKQGSNNGTSETLTPIKDKVTPNCNKSSSSKKRKHSSDGKDNSPTKKIKQDSNDGTSE